MTSISCMYMHALLYAALVCLASTLLVALLGQGKVQLISALVAAHRKTRPQKRMLADHAETKLSMPSTGLAISDMSCARHSHECSIVSTSRK